jgi:hypothetical protein
MGRPKGDYAALHPNDDVNMAQSTNDAYPTALRLAIIFAAAPLIASLDELAFAFKSKAVEFGDVLKIGRTQLQDAVPMTLGQEFDAYFATIKEDIARLKEAAALFREVNLGATAIGTGINADPRYAALAIEELSRASREPMVPASNLIEATSDMGAFVLFSGVLKRVAVKLSKICNDLRLLSSGPRAGFAEIRLPTVQAGSSIMPGKVNPVIPAQRIRADHRLLRVVVASHPDGRGQYAGQEVCGGHRGRSGEVPRARRGQHRIGDGAGPGAGLRDLLPRREAGARTESQGRRHRPGGETADAGADEPPASSGRDDRTGAFDLGSQRR